MRSNAWRLTPQRLLTALLIAATLLGMLGTLETHRKMQAGKQERAQLFVEFGDFNPRDPAKCELLKLPNPHPREFRWRYYQPPGAEMQVEVTRGYYSMATRPIRIGIVTGGQEAMLRLYLVAEEEQSAFFYDGGSLSGRWGLKDEFYPQLLRDHWEDLQIELLETPSPQQFSEDEIVTLARITIPRHLLTNFRFANFTADQMLLQMRVGSKAAFELEAAKNGGSISP